MMQLTIGPYLAKRVHATDNLVSDGTQHLLSFYVSNSDGGLATVCLSLPCDEYGEMLARSIVEAVRQVNARADGEPKNKAA